MHDNKLRLSADIISKAEEIAETWGLKNSRAAIEAVFRKYADDYLYGRQPMMMAMANSMGMPEEAMMGATEPGLASVSAAVLASATGGSEVNCDALSELDNLLGL
jgi:hypothetical protein